MNKRESNHKGNTRCRCAWQSHLFTEEKKGSTARHEVVEERHSMKREVIRRRMRRERCRTRANASPNVRERDTEKNLKKKKNWDTAYIEAA